MAEGKKSFIAYSDWDGMFKALPDEVAGKLIKHIFAYVNDQNPESNDYIINALFEQIKATLKRDLKKWDAQREQRSEAGKKSAELRAATKSNERSIPLNETQRNPTVSVSVNVNDIDIKNNNIDSRKLKFAHSLKQYLSIYSKETIREFYDYWTEHGEKDTKFRMEKEKSFGIERRLKTWTKNNYNNKHQNNEQLNTITAAIRENNPGI